MALDVLITTNRIATDAIGREFVDHIRAHSGDFGLDDGIIYYDFPTYADYETVTHKPDVLVVSKTSGVLAVRFLTSLMPPLSEARTREIDESLGQFCSILIGRLLKSRSLRKDLSTLGFPITPVLYIPAGAAAGADGGVSRRITSLQGFRDLLAELARDPMSEDALAELRSVVEGAKALTRPQRRTIENPSVQRQATALAALEMEIANFDVKQRRAALVATPGPQRIRGLAGSGKTVILAMRAANLHLTNPDQNILVTFFTRSLRTSIKSMITRFYRHYRDEDPDWEKIHIRHGWGGARSPGVYADASRREGRAPVPLSVAQQNARGKDAFDYVCRELVAHGVRQFYDHVLIDEGQDFPGGFYELCFYLAKGDRDQKNIVWAYDELQNILNVTLRSPDQLFGIDDDGQARISLERAEAHLPPGTDNDTVLSKCYRNQREVLVTAHALGFGIFDGIVQLLESKEHWEDVGYEVLTNPDFIVGQPVRIERPAYNNPLSLPPADAGKIVATKVADGFDEEVAWVVNGILDFVGGGLQPEDIIVIALDDRNARAYFRAVSGALAAKGLASNNLLADPYTEPPFQIAGMVTLSTVYRAKGNEAAVVFVVGVDGIPLQLRSGRNRLFTAFTRTKAWLRISGIGAMAKTVCAEVAEAQAHFPFLEFTMPDLREVELIQRDLSKRSVKAKAIRDEYVKRMKDEGFSEDEIADLLSMDDVEE